MIPGVVKFVPVPKALPPVEFANHEMVPADAVALRLTVPGPILDPGVVLVIVGELSTIVNVLAVPLPQEFDGVTVTFPKVPFVVTVIELVVPPAVCTHPAGNVQL